MAAVLFCGAWFVLQCIVTLYVVFVITRFYVFLLFLAHVYNVWCIKFHSVLQNVHGFM